MNLSQNVVDVKAVILGESRVGKTTLAQRYTTTVFSEHTTATINASCFNKSTFINTTPIKYYIWDTAGQEQFRSLSPVYYRSCNVAVIIYDITNLLSLEVTNFWVNELRDNGPPGVPIVVVGNKSDLDNFRQISTEDGKSFAESIGAEFFEVSALTGTGVDEAFNKALDLGYAFSKSSKLTMVTQVPQVITTNAENAPAQRSCC